MCSIFLLPFLQLILMSLLWLLLLFIFLIIIVIIIISILLILQLYININEFYVMCTSVQGYNTTRQGIGNKQITLSTTCKKKEKERLNEIYSALSLLHIFHLGIFFFILFVFFSFLVACFSFIFRCVHFEWEIQFLSVWESERNGTAMRWKIRRSSSEKQENINWKKNILQ